MILTQTIKRYVIAAVVAVFVFLLLATGVLYMKTVSLQKTNMKLTAQVTELTSANESLQTEIIKRQAVEQISDRLTTELGNISATIERKARENQYAIHDALKNQPCANTMLPDDVHWMLKPSSKK